MKMESRFLVVLAFAVSLGSPQVGIADDAPAPIRAFDIPTIEKLGRDMYEQDRWAWVATDVLRAAHSDRELKGQKLHGWIVDKTADGAIVRFVHETDDGPELLYDVTFSGSAPPALSIPPTPTLTPDESVQYTARTTALANVDIRCEESYNTIVLKDPERNDWLVWVMSATTDPDKVVIGGHIRFTVSSDGKSILQKDRLSRACFSFPKPKDQRGDPIGMFVSHVVSPLPVETHVFANLSYKTKLFVGVPDGNVWKVDDGRVTPTYDDSPDPDGFMARMYAGQEEKCFSILEKPVDGTIKYGIGGNQKVIESTEHDAFKPVPEEGKISAITCVRQSFVPFPNDYKVVLAGYPLMIGVRNSENSRLLGTLGMKNGRFVFEFEGGTLPADVQMKIDARIASFNSKLQH